MGVEHRPMEGQLVMKEGSWKKLGSLTRTVIYSGQDAVVASRDTWKEKASSGSSR